MKPHKKNKKPQPRTGHAFKRNKSKYIPLWHMDFSLDGVLDPLLDKYNLDNRQARGKTKQEAALKYVTGLIKVLSKSLRTGEVRELVTKGFEENSIYKECRSVVDEEPDDTGCEYVHDSSREYCSTCEELIQECETNTCRCWDDEQDC